MELRTLTSAKAYVAERGFVLAETGVSGQAQRLRNTLNTVVELVPSIAAVVPQEVEQSLAQTSRQILGVGRDSKEQATTDQMLATFGMPIKDIELLAVPVITAIRGHEERFQDNLSRTMRVAESQVQANTAQLEVQIAVIAAELAAVEVQIAALVAKSKQEQTTRVTLSDTVVSQVDGALKQNALSQLAESKVVAEVKITKLEKQRRYLTAQLAILGRGLAQLGELPETFGDIADLQLRSRSPLELVHQ